MANAIHSCFVSVHTKYESRTKMSSRLRLCTINAIKILQIEFEALFLGQIFRQNINHDVHTVHHYAS